MTPRAKGLLAVLMVAALGASGCSTISRYNPFHGAETKEVATEGPLHDRTFTMGVLAPDGSVVAVSTARNKKVAEQEASRKALLKLGVLEE